jgi:hypothetical protein
MNRCPSLLQEAGNHKIYVLVDGVELSGCPYMASVFSGTPVASKTKAIGSAVRSCVVGIEQTFVVQPRDEFSNAVRNAVDRVHARLIQGITIQELPVRIGLDLAAAALAFKALFESRMPSLACLI